MGLKHITIIIFLLLSVQLSMGQYYKPRQNNKEDTDKNPRKKLNKDTTNQDKSQSAKDSSGKKPGFMDKIYSGGGFSLQFGTITQIYIAPMIGYRVTDNFSAGLRGTYMYYRLRERIGTQNVFIEDNVYGGSIFSRYRINNYLFAQAELENLNVKYFDTNTDQEKRRWISSPLIGLGYFQSIGGQTGITFMALYNFNYIPNVSPYSSPLIFRFGITL